MVTLSGDIVLAIAAYLLCFYVRSVTTFPLGADVMPLNRFQHLPHYWSALIISQVVWIYFLGLYDQIWTRSPSEIVFAALAGTAVQTLFLGTFYGFASQSIFPRTVFPLFWILNSTLIFLWRSLLTRLFQIRETRRVLVVGLNDASKRLVRLIETQHSLGLEIIGMLSEKEEFGAHPDADFGEKPGALPSTFCGLPVLGSVRELDDHIEQHKPDEVILSSGVSWQDRLMDSLGRAARPGLRLSLLPSVYEILIGKARHLKIRDVPLIEVAGDPNTPSRLMIKRLLDLLFASTLLVMLAPLWVLVALGVKLSSAGPALYFQSRVGKDGRAFTVLKFRTMIHHAEQESGAVLSAEADPRVTPMGRILRRTRLDELPQLINVLRGDMSFIGPRPERPVFVEQFVKTLPGYSQRHQVKPGITGLAQINGYYDTDVDNKLKYDLYYIHNYTLWMDFMIVLETLKTMLARKGL